MLAAEFQTLATYEATFQVRRASLYTLPDAGYGYSGYTAQTATLATSCTTAGRAVFPYANCASVSIGGVTAYRATAIDAATVPLLTDSSGRILAATRAYGDGREALSLTFAQSASLFHTLQLFHGVVSWATRGVFLGEAEVDDERRQPLLGPVVQVAHDPPALRVGCLDEPGARRAQALAERLALGDDRRQAERRAPPPQQLERARPDRPHPIRRAPTTKPSDATASVADGVNNNINVSNQFGCGRSRREPGEPATRGSPPRT
jgi:hypothetical protein